MKKPISLLNSFLSFIELCRTYSNESIQMKKLNLNEAEVFNKLKITKEKVHMALCDE